MLVFTVILFLAMFFGARKIFKNHAIKQKYSQQTTRKGRMIVDIVIVIYSIVMFFYLYQQYESDQEADRLATKRSETVIREIKSDANDFSNNGSNSAPLSSDFAPNHLFYFAKDHGFGCVSKVALNEFAHDSSDELDREDLDRLTRTGQCFSDLPTDIQWKVEELDGPVLAFYNASETDNRLTLYTTSRALKTSNTPTPFGSYLRTPTIKSATTYTNPHASLKPGDVFYINPETPITCRTEAQLAELYTAASKHDLTNFNHLILGGIRVGCEGHLFTRFGWTVDGVEKVAGINEDVVHFHHINNPDDKVGMFTLVEFTSLKPFPNQDSENGRLPSGSAAN
jgi:hypothetical protein